MQVRAKALLEAEGYVVLAGFLSPSHDLYVGPKARRNKVEFVDAHHRVAMARLAVLPWMSVGTWEARQKGYWPDYPVVLKKLDSYVQSLPNSTDVKVFYVCGADHAAYCSGGFGGGRLGLVAVPRLDEPVGKNFVDKHVHWATAACVVPPEWPSQVEIESFSSTKVRLALQNNDRAALVRMMGEEVTTYILTHGLYARAGHELKEIQEKPVSSSSHTDSSEQKRIVFISATALARQWTKVPKQVLQQALFFFGSKEKWLFPSTPEEQAEANAQPGEYALMDPAFKSLVRQKLTKGDVFFLKRPDLDYKRYPGPPDPEAYTRVSNWLVSRHCEPLHLDPKWWRENWPKEAEAVIKNFEGGFHEYREVEFLLLRSNLFPVYIWK